MAVVAPRILYNNLIQGSGVVLVPSSEETSRPRAALLSHHPSDAWRSKSGWIFATGVNDAMDLDMNGIPGGSIVATLAAGTYATPTAVSTAVVTALEAATSAPVWASSRSSNKYVISADVSSQLLAGAGNVNLAHSAYDDLGYDFSDTLFQASHTADFVSYQGRHWMCFDLGAAIAFKAVVMIGDNVGANGSARLDADATTLVTQGLRASVDFTTAVALDGSVTYFSQQTLRYLRLVLNDIQNTDAYGEVGVLFVGDYLDLAGFEPEVVDVREELSEISYAIGGAHFTTTRATRRTWELRLHRFDAAGKTALETFAAQVKIGGAFFFNFDSADPTNTRYVHLSEGVRFEAQRTSPVTWQASMRFREVLG